MSGKYTKEYIQNLTENELRNQIVIPLFQAMKSIVYETHGALEFGKDLIVYNRDSTGETVYSAIQIKAKDIHGKTETSGNIRTIIHQCESAFEIPFIDTNDGSQKFVEKVFVVTSGKITPSAANIISYALRKHGAVRFWDIERLVDQSQRLLAADEAQQTQEVSKSRVTSGYTTRIATGCGYIYVTYNNSPKGNPLVMAILGKAGGCASANLEAICALATIALKKGATEEEVEHLLRGIRCPSIAWENGKAILSCADAIGVALSEGNIKKG